MSKNNLETILKELWRQKNLTSEPMLIERAIAAVNTLTYHDIDFRTWGLTPGQLYTGGELRALISMAHTLNEAMTEAQPVSSFEFVVFDFSTKQVDPIHIVDAAKLWREYIYDQTTVDKALALDKALDMTDMNPLVPKEMIRPDSDHILKKNLEIKKMLDEAIAQLLNQ